MSHRFYNPQLAESGSVILEDTEAHHLVHVLRHQVDEVVELFNGNGLSALCRITHIRKRDVSLEIQSTLRDLPRQNRLTLATAVPKGDRFDWLIEKATELGVSRLIPVTTQRSVVDPRTSKLEKLRNTVITACKQCGRNDLMEITPVISWNELVRASVSDHRVLIAHPQGDSLTEGIKKSSSWDRPVLAAIGPEGGFSDDEFHSAVSVGAEAVHLGAHILRIETAAIAIAAKLLL